MTSVQIKICGLSTAETVDAAMTAGASHIGLNFYAPSPRYVAPRAAAALAERTGSRVCRVGVFVDADDSLLADAVAAARLDAIQLHGGETPQRVAELKARFALPVWKVLSVADAGDIARAALYSDAADFILFDAKTPKGTLPGGMGLAFDWALLAHHRHRLPWGLAGGLSSANVADALRQTGASLVDTSSGVESAPGVKDVDRIRAFCQAAKI